MRSGGEFIGKTVLSTLGVRLGEINNLTFDKYFNKLKNIMVFNDEQDEFEIAISSIFCHGDSVVLVKPLLNFCKNTYLSPLAVKAYDIKGNFLGVVCDIEFEQDQKTTTCLVLDNGQKIDKKNVVSHGKDAVICDFSLNPKRISIRLAPSNTTLDIVQINAPTSSNAQEYAADVQNQIDDNIAPQELAQGQDMQIVTKPPKLPDNFVVGAKLLIGKKVRKNIYAKNGTLVIKQSTVITNSTINIALQHGKLFELTINALGNATLS